MSGRPAVFATFIALAPVLLAAQQVQPGANARDLERLRVGEQITNLPPADSVTAGARSVAAGTTVKGTLVAGTSPVELAESV